MLQDRLAAVASQAFSTDGGTDGSVSIVDTSFFKVKQHVIVQATGQTNQELEVKRVVSPTSMILGPISGAINTFTDLSAYTVVANALIFANEQRRPTITADNFERAMYEEEPTVAERTVLVDEFGNKYNATNPLPTSATLTVSSIEIGKVDQGTPNTLADAWPVKVTDGTFVLGTSINPLKVDPTGTTIQPVSGTVDIGNKASVQLHDTNNNPMDVREGDAPGTTGGLLAMGIGDEPTPLVHKLCVDADGSLDIEYADTPVIDAFSRLRVSTPTTLFDSKMLVDAVPLFWDDQQVTGSGTTSTYQTNQSMVRMAVGNLTAGKRVRQTFRRFNYRPGKSLLVMMTGVLGAGQSGITRRLGQFEDKNGLFFQLSGSTLSVVKRTYTSGSPVDTAIAQASWNLDTLDGNGPSGITLNTANSQIFIIDYQWLGVGRVRFGFNIDGQIRYCHQMLNANTIALPYTQTPNLPLRYEISNDGTGAAAALNQISSTVMSEGGIEDTGIVRSVDRGATELITLNNTSIYPLIAIRLQAGRSQDASITPLNLSAYCSTNAGFRWTLLLNPTVVGTAFNFVAIPNSAVEADVGTTNATTITSGTGTRIMSGYVSASTTTPPVILPSYLVPGSNIAGVSDILVLAVQRLTGTTEHIFGSMGWREEI